MLFSLRSISPKKIRYRGDILIIEKKRKSFTLFVMFFLLLSGLTGLEPATSAVTGRRSNQLNYSPLYMHTILPYSWFFGNCFILHAQKRKYWSQRIESFHMNEIVPLAVTEWPLRGIIRIPYFIPLHCISTFSCPIEVGLPLYERTGVLTHTHVFT